jgi:hypothetical protein
MLMTVAHSVRFRKASLRLAATTAELRTAHAQCDRIAAEQEDALREFRTVVADATGLSIELGLTPSEARIPAPA